MRLFCEFEAGYSICNQINLKQCAVYMHTCQVFAYYVWELPFASELYLGISMYMVYMGISVEHRK